MGLPKLQNQWPGAQAEGRGQEEQGPLSAIFFEAVLGYSYSQNDPGGH